MLGKERYAVKIWNARTLRLTRVLDQGKGWDVPWPLVAFSPDGATLATGGVKEIRLWNAKTGAPQGIVRGSESFLTETAWLARGDVFVCDGGATVRVYDARTWRVRHAFAKRFESASFSPDGAKLVTRSNDAVFSSYLELRNAQTGAMIRSLTPHGPRPTFWPRWLVNADPDFDPGIYFEPVQAAAFSPDGATIAYATANDIKLIAAP